ncbi:RagB/SusD family nutrient uptake outer membrane protein [Marinoscillum sp. 108]|uniref:RagB/SusD family nutrient uptake outer membrane protein n=1 Tax=Marinoscillum sp. 108 TaxID=2653151 RepID=UPI0012F0045D|nr:RagB/SusD family nutrient uptake outer membrane protein [Marinoscillum sp. 108]VXD13236.1 RagB/SusD family nutrient uptake outer membrane protein [Marinoscillum sp. 108]
MKRIITYLVVIAVISSCADLDLVPKDAQSELNYWQTEEDARIFLNSMYADLMSADSYLLLSALSDDAYTRAQEGYRNIANGNYDASNGVVRGMWSGRYASIRRSNIFLNNINNVVEISEEKRAAYIAEARFIRAWHYFYLIELFGDVPFITDEISIEESLEVTRTDEAEILGFIYDELDLAISDLPSDVAGDQQGRITSGAAIAFKSRVHLYNGQHSEAAALAGQLIDEYALFPDYGGLFNMANENNEEVILSLQYVPVDREHGIQYFLIPPSLGGYANFSPLQELVDSYPMANGLAIDDPLSGYDESNPYQNRDPRLSATIIHDEYSLTDFSGNEVTIDTSPGAEPNGLNFSSNSTPTGYYVSKFYDQQARNVSNSGLNLIVIRYAEVLLNYAEAKIESGTFTSADWNNTVRQIRERAGLSGAAALNYPGNDQEALRTIVRNERRLELAFEAGHRFFDIRRWQIADEVLDGWAHGIQTNVSPQDDGYERVDLRTFDTDKHYLWPIPQSERDINDKLSQNPNW